MERLEGWATFEEIESKFNFSRRIRQGTVEVPTLWLNLAMYMLRNVEKGWKKQMEIHVDKSHGGSHLICSVLRADDFGDVAVKKAFGADMKELIAEAEICDLEATPAILWWSGTFADDVKEDITMKTRRGQHKFPFVKSFKNLGHLCNPTSKSHECAKERERVQKTNKAWWRDARIYRSKDVPWRIKCKRMVEQVYSVCSSRYDSRS